MASIRIKAFPSSLALILLILSNLTISLSSASRFAWNGPTPHEHFRELESVSGILSARGGSEIKSLSNAKRILQDLSSSPSCAYAPMARLLQQCKIIKPKTQDGSSDQQKANVQATYGITMALCEARQARVSVPATCHVFESLLESHVSDTSIQIVRSADIEECMNSLFDTASWTSYITFRAQSTDLCDSSRIDYQREEMLETFRRATDVIPEVLEALQTQQQETYVVMAGVRDLSTEVAEAQRELVASNHKQVQQAKDHLRQMSDYVEIYMQAMSESGKSWQADLKSGVEQASKDLAVMSSKASNMQVNLGELYASAAEVVSGLTYDFESSVDVMRQEAVGFVENLAQLNLDNQLQKIQQGLELGKLAASEFTTTQRTQNDMAQEQLSTSQELLRIIDDSRGHFHHLKETLEMIPDSWLSSLKHVQQIVLRTRAEATYALVPVSLCVLLLLLGRLRQSAITIVLYVLMRASWSIGSKWHCGKSSVAINDERLKLTWQLAVIAVISGAIVPAVSKLVPGTRRSQVHKEVDVEHQPGMELRQELAISFARAKSLARPGAKSFTKEVDRSTRALTAPPGF